MKYVLSVMANAVSYCFYTTPQPGVVPAVRKKVRIEGGTGIPSVGSGIGHREADVATGVPLWTADGVVTPIKDEDYAELVDHKVFKSHLESGMIKVINSDISANHSAISKTAQHMGSDDFKPLNKTTVKNLKVSTSHD